MLHYIVGSNTYLGEGSEWGKAGEVRKGGKGGGEGEGIGARRTALACLSVLYVSVGFCGWLVSLPYSSAVAASKVLLFSLVLLFRLGYRLMEDGAVFSTKWNIDRRRSWERHGVVLVLQFSTHIQVGDIYAIPE